MTEPKGLAEAQRYKENKWGSSGVQRCLKWCMGKQWQVEKSPRTTSGSHARSCQGGGVKEPPWASCNTGEDVRNRGREGGSGDPWETTDR